LISGPREAGERGARVQQRLGVDGGVDEHADVAEHDALGAGELGERLLVDWRAALERFRTIGEPSASDASNRESDQ
jgi:hypothetical protein